MKACSNPRCATWGCAKCDPGYGVGWGDMADALKYLARRAGGCAVCGAPEGTACTPSCNDDTVPDEAVKAWAPKCECGSAAVGAPGHSSWCPVRS